MGQFCELSFTVCLLLIIAANMRKKQCSVFLNKRTQSRKNVKQLYWSVFLHRDCFYPVNCVFTMITTKLTLKTHKTFLTMLKKKKKGRWILII